MSAVVDTESDSEVNRGPLAVSRSWGERWADNRFPVLCFLGIAAVLYVTVWGSTAYLSRNAGYPIQIPLVFRGARVLEGWVRAAILAATTEDALGGR